MSNHSRFYTAARDDKGDNHNSEIYANHWLLVPVNSSPSAYQHSVFTSWIPFPPDFMLKAAVNNHVYLIITAIQPTLSKHQREKFLILQKYL